MKQKIFITILICCVIVPMSVFGAYQFGVSIGSSEGYKLGYYNGQISSIGSSHRAYDSGYNDGLKAAQSIPTPSPIPTSTP